MKRKRRTRKKIITVSAIIAAIGIIITIAAVCISCYGKVFPNIYLKDIELSGFDYDGIMSTLEGNGWNGRESALLKVETYFDASVDINPVDAGVIIDSKSAASEALRYGKTEGIYKNLLAFIRCLGTKTDINSLTAVLNEDYVSSKIDELQARLDEKDDYDSFSIDSESGEIIICKGYGSTLKLNRELLTEQIIAALENGESSISFTQPETDAAMPDFEQLRSRIPSEPVDACFSSDGSHTIIDEIPGYTFDDTIASALWKSAAPGEEIRIPAEIHHSEITAEVLENLMYRDLIGAMTTKYNNSGENRSSNVRLATSLVNGSVIFPGEEFSFNQTVGKRTEEAGFTYAPAYAGYDNIREEIGGGVCQVSTGIYASALFTFLEITSHTCHIYPPNYIQLGTDATVSIPESGREIDLKFRNNKSFPIKIVGYCEETVDADTGKAYKTCTIEIWGTLEADDYMPIEFDNAWGDVYDYDRKINPAYEGREGYRIQFTHDETEFEDDTGKGLRTLTYRRVYDSSGNLVEKLILNKEYDFGYGMDTYYYIQ